MDEFYFILPSIDRYTLDVSKLKLLLPNSALPIPSAQISWQRNLCQMEVREFLERVIR
jgi:hypothetical protein